MSTTKLNRVLLQATQQAAVSAFQYLGQKNKHIIDQVATMAIQKTLHESQFKFQIVNSEGAMEKSPMLTVGAVFGKTTLAKNTYDLMADPVEGTKNCAYKSGPAISCLAVTKQKQICPVIEMYMEKVFLAPKFKLKLVNFNLIEIINQLLLVSDKITVAILDKPRHQHVFNQLSKYPQIHLLKVKDGDVILAMECANNEIDLVYGIGGSVEGSLMAALAIAVNANFIARFIRYNQIWPNEKKALKITTQEEKWLATSQWKWDTLYTAHDLVLDQHPVFAASYIFSFKPELEIIKTVNNHYRVISFLAANSNCQQFSQIINFAS